MILILISSINYMERLIIYHNKGYHLTSSRTRVLDPGEVLVARRHEGHGQQSRHDDEPAFPEVAVAS